jgi:hypothetical protein
MIEDGDALRVELLAYSLWQQRGSPLGSPHEDWFRAEEELRVERQSTSLPLYAMGIERSTQGSRRTLLGVP